MEAKEKLKKLAKLEKNEKGHNAMTEELRKMEEETGLSVSVSGGATTRFDGPSLHRHPILTNVITQSFRSEALALLHPRK